MSHTKTMMMTLLAITTTWSMPAAANNAKIERALKSNAEFASFYEAFNVTGVAQELNENTSYTLFVPTNAAFAAISKEQYPCFYSESCKAQIANVVRSHIVVNEQHVEDVVKQKGVLFAINKRTIPIGMPNPNRFTADGHNIVRTYGILSNVVYAIDGLITNAQELSVFAAPVSSNVTQKVLSYSPAGTVDAKTTIIETTTTTTGPAAQ